MAMTIVPFGALDEAIVVNHVQVAHERGIDLVDYARTIEPESPPLAAELRRRAEAASARKAAPAAEAAPVSRKAPRGETA